MDIEKELDKFVKRIADGKVFHSGMWNCDNKPFDYWEFEQGGKRHSISLEKIPHESKEEGL